MTISIWEVALCICIGLIGFCLGALVMITVAKRDLKKIREELVLMGKDEDKLIDSIKHIIKNQKLSPREFDETVDNHFWDLIPDFVIKGDRK